MPDNYNFMIRRVKFVEFVYFQKRHLSVCNQVITFLSSYMEILFLRVSLIE